MKNRVWPAFVVALALSVVAGCASSKSVTAAKPASTVAAAAQARDAQPEDDQTKSSPKERARVWNASLSLVVENVQSAVAKADHIAEKNGGYMENQTSDDENSATARLRVPSKSLKGALDELSALGTVKSRVVASEDVTERYVDLDARLKNMIVSRDRLRKLLESARDVKDALAIEKELSRVQGDIDALEATLRSLKGRIDFATIDLALREERILGPISCFFYGLFWGLGKLFLIQG